MMDNNLIISWNCNGLNPHISELLNYLDKNTTKPIIICLQESNLYSSVLPAIPQYSLLNTPRPNNNPGGGTAIYIQSNIPYSQTNFCEDLEQEIKYK